MSDFMNFLYAHYIKPYIAAQPRDDGDLYRESSCDCNFNECEHADIAAVVAFSATHAFLLGMRTGAGLKESSPTTPAP